MCYVYIIHCFTLLLIFGFSVLPNSYFLLVMKYNSCYLQIITLLQMLTPINILTTII